MRLCPCLILITLTSCRGGGWSFSPYGETSGWTFDDRSGGAVTVGLLAHPEAPPPEGGTAAERSSFREGAMELEDRQAAPAPGASGASGGLRTATTEDAAAHPPGGAGGASEPARASCAACGASWGTIGPGAWARCPICWVALPEPEPGPTVSVEVEERPAPEPEVSEEDQPGVPWKEILAFGSGALALFGGQRGVRAGRAAWERRQRPEVSHDGF